MAALPLLAVAPDAVTLGNSIKPITAPAPAPGIESHVPYIARAAISADEAAAPIHFEIALKLRNFADLQARINRGEIISPQEMVQKYEPTSANYDKVATWAQSQGYVIDQRDDHHVGLFVHAPVSKVQSSMGVTFARVKFHGEEFTSAVTAPRVPAWMSSMIVGVNGLQPHLHPHKHMVKQVKRPDLGGGSGDYKPSQIATAYNADTLYASNITGAGETIAIVIDTFPATSDLQLFWNKTGVAQSLDNIQFVLAVQPQPGTALAAPSGEETLDAEWASGMAPGAKVRIYASTDLSNDNLDAAYAAVYADATSHPEYNIHQMSMSFGEGEQDITPFSQLDTDDQYYAELAAIGVTCFASTGDSGSTPDDTGVGLGETGPLQAESPATDPNVTAVGGTSLQLNSSNHETSESVWDNGTGASGGGTSIHFDRPSWQTGTGVKLSAKRQIPDISLTADPNFGAITYMQGVEQTVGGTSWACPSMAAFNALMNQARAAAGQGPIGLLGPKIYPQIGTANLRDITSGSNATSASGGKYAATVGFDQATGVGVPLMQSLTQTVVGSSNLIGVTPQASMMEVQPNQPASFTVATNGSATYQWQREPIGSGSWSNISDSSDYTGSLTASIAINDPTLAMSGDQFRCVIGLSSGTVTTNPSVLVVEHPFDVSALAGAGTTGSQNGTGTSARFNYPSSAAVDGSGNVFVADFSNNSIRKITPAGVVTTPYGSTTAISGNTNGSGNNARFNNPNGVAFDPSGNLYVADTGNNSIRKITTAGVVSTLAGGFNDPEALACDASGNVYVADTLNNVIKKVTPGGSVSRIAGVTSADGGYQDGAANSALFNQPSGIAVDGSGNIYVADYGNYAVRKISGSTVTTIAGQGGQGGYLDGLAANTLFNAPLGVCLDASGNLYITDADVPGAGSNAAGNDVIRKLSPAGVVSTMAGNPGAVGRANGTGVSVTFQSLQAIAFSNGTYYLADTYNQLIRKAVPSVKQYAQVHLATLSVPFDDTLHSDSATTIPGSLAVAFTYNGSSTPPTNAGTYTVIGTVTDPGYNGTATGTLVINKTTVTPTFGTLTFGYTGTGHPVTVSALGQPATITYTNNATGVTSSTPPIAVGTYNVVATVNTQNATGTNSTTETITPGTATVNFGTLTFVYSGLAHIATATTSPKGLAITFTYNGSATAPTAVGAYTVVATVHNANYIGTATSTLNITPVPPLVTTLAATSVTGMTALLNGSANPKSTDTQVHFDWGTTTAYANSTATQDLGSGIVAANFSQGITFPASTTATTYHYRTVANNGISTVNGIDHTFIALGRPAIATSPAASLGATGAEVNLTVNPDGAATSVFIKYGTDTSYGSMTSTVNIGAGKAAIPVFLLFSGLQANKLYHYQVFMTGPAGTYTSDDETFTTLGFDLQRVAQKSDTAGSTGTTFSTFGPPIVNQDDTVAFASTLSLATGITATNDSTIWNIDSTNTQLLVAQTGTTAPGTGATFAALSDPVFNDNAQTAFRGMLKVVAGQATATTAAGIWSNSSGSLSLVARQGSTAPGAGSGIFTTFPALGLTQSAGTVVYASIAGTGITAANNVGIWEGNSTADLTLKLRLGDIASGKTITRLVVLPAETYVNGQTRSFNASGALVAAATFSDKTTGIVFNSGATKAIIAVSGSGGTVAGIPSATFASFTNPIINDNGHVAFQARLTPGLGGVAVATSVGIWADDSSDTRHLIAQSGTGIAPSGAGPFTAFSDPVYNNNEAVAFRGVAGGLAGIWSNSGGSLAKVALQATQAPGCPAGAKFATFTSLALPDQGGAVFSGTLTANAAAGVTAANGIGIWAVDTTNTLQLIVRTGNILDGKIVTALQFLPSPAYVNGQSRSFAQANGDLVFVATFSDKSTAIYSVVFP